MAAGFGIAIVAALVAFATPMYWRIQTTLRPPQSIVAQPCISPPAMNAVFVQRPSARD
jgi:hypothetical protein